MHIQADTHTNFKIICYFVLFKDIRNDLLLDT